jgi:hypothetical protein
LSVLRLILIDKESLEPLQRTRFRPDFSWTDICWKDQYGQAIRTGVTAPESQVAIFRDPVDMRLGPVGFGKSER